MQAIIVDDLFSPNGLLVLFHELGHCREYSSADEQTQNAIDQSRNKLSLRLCRYKYSDARRVIESERNAWAFALWALKPFITKKGILDRQSAQAIIHNNYLSTYGKAIAARIDKELFEN